MLENAALLMFGSGFRSVSTPYQTSSLQLGPLFVSVPYLAAFAMSVASGLALWIFLKSSWSGRAMRATAQDPMAARLMGIDADRMHMLAFALGVGSTAFGGAVILPYLTASPTVGTQFAVLMFTVVVLGGLGSVAGAVVGGLAVGIIQSLSALVFPDPAAEPRPLRRLHRGAGLPAEGHAGGGPMSGVHPGNAAGLALLAALAIALPFAFEPRGYGIRILCLALLFAAMAQAWNIVAGLANQISLRPRRLLRHRRLHLDAAADPFRHHALAA